MNPKKILQRLLIGLFPLALSSACATPPPGSPGGPPPLWTQQPARTAENGYIIYVGNGEDRTIERSHFKASGMAIQDLVNECSLAPKGTRTEDSFQQEDEKTHLYKSWVKVSIQYEDCEDAKKAVDPETIRKLANAQLTEELKRYQQMVDEPAPPLLAGGNPQGSQGMNPALGNNGGTYYGPSNQGYVQVVAVNNTGSYFWARQQVAYTKQVVILAPPGQYQPGTPQTAQFVHQVAPAQASVQQYEASNPQTRTWNQAYSGSPVRQQMIQQRAAAAGSRMMNNRQQGRQGGGQGNGNGRKRKRHYNN